MAWGDFDENKQNQKVLAGLKGGPFYQKPMLGEKMSVKEGWPVEIAQERQSSTAAPSGGTENPWFNRRK